jgi:hypothetical protein
MNENNKSDGAKIKQASLPLQVVHILNCCCMLGSDEFY